MPLAGFLAQDNINIDVNYEVIPSATVSNTHQTGEQAVCDVDVSTQVNWSDYSFVCIIMEWGQHSELR